MIGLLSGIPENVAGFRASGEVTREDYEKIVFPEVRRRVQAFGQLNLVFFVDTSLKNFSAGAWVRDIWLGIKELVRWHKVAIISDVEKIRSFTDTISHLLPGEYKGFPASRLEDAIRWASVDEDETADKALPEYIEALLPARGKARATQTMAHIETEREAEAPAAFDRIVERLQDVNRWGEYCNDILAGFQLTDEAGKFLQGRASAGDFIRVERPDGSQDWVEIEKCERPAVVSIGALADAGAPAAGAPEAGVPAATDDLFLLRLRACRMPPSDGELPATGTLIIERKGRQLSAAFYGRNIGPGNASGLPLIHWRALVRGLLKEE